jgi:osmotically-inducible protein OsmY
MSVMYPLAIVSTSSITSLVRMTLYHHSISFHPAKVSTNGDVAALGGNARNAATENPVTQLASEIPGVRTVKNQMAVEEAKSK